MNPRWVSSQDLIVHVYTFTCFFNFLWPCSRTLGKNGCAVNTSQSQLWARKQKALNKAVGITFGTNFLPFRIIQSIKKSLKTSTQIQIWQGTLTSMCSYRKTYGSNITAITEFEVVTAGFLKIQVFGTLCRLVFFPPEQKVTKFIKDVYKCLAVDMTWHARTPEYAVF
jgi:hypothetical protein